jgi:EAL domain-containing protein (putative c-di-GMP-specific phosphodiesterase class I)
VGRRSTLPLSLPLPTVSNVHAELLVDGDSLRVRDFGSTNGTFVNGTRIHEETPVRHGDLVQFAEVVFRVGRERGETKSQTIASDSADHALALIQFDQLIAQRAVVPFFQPLVSARSQQNAGYEVLGRSRLFGLKGPAEMFRAAAALNAVAELSRLFRTEGVRVGLELPGTPNLFLNTHPVELADTELLGLCLRELREIRPVGPMTLEIHEGAVTNPQQMRELSAALSDAGFKLAYDDFGAGQARLLELAEVPPAYLKFDAKLVCGIQHASPQRLTLLETLVRMASELGITTVAEGIELQEEHNICVQVGFDLVQGFLHGRPAPVKDFRAGAEPAELVTDELAASLRQTPVHAGTAASVPSCRS